MDEKSIDSFELFAKYTQATQRAAVAKFKATSRMFLDSKKANWAAYFRELETFNKLRGQMFVRLGIVDAPQLTNFDVFAYLSRLRKKARCAMCSRQGGWESRYLNWYYDKVPALLLMAMAGRNLKIVESWAPRCIALCTRCAKRDGVKMTPKGQPDLRPFKNWVEEVVADNE